MAHIITLSNNTDQYYFAGSPVVVNVTVDANTFPEDSSLRKMNILVSCLHSINGHDYTSSFIFQGETDNGETYTADISTALRAAMSRRVVSPTSTSIMNKVQFKVTVYASYLLDGEDVSERNTPKQVDTGNELYNAQPGMFTELELMINGGNRIPATLDFSTKPTEGALCYPGYRIRYVMRSQQGILPVTFVVDSAPTDVTCTVNNRTYYIERNAQCYSLLFLNRRGMLEDACCMPLEALQFNMDKKEYQQQGLPSETPVSSLRAVRPSIRRSYAMSSGYTTQEMADWWITEFLASEHYWLLLDGRWIPVSVVPTNKKLTEYDKANPGACSVNFTVTLALEG